MRTCSDATRIRIRISILQDDPNNSTIRPTIAKNKDKHTHRHTQQRAPTWTGDATRTIESSDDPTGR
jgi:hypothetical protein